MPHYDVLPEASAVNNLTKINGELHFKGKKVHSLSPAMALQRFNDWLTSLKTSPDDKIVLVGHNAFQFDAPVLLNNLLKSGLLCDVVDGFVDTLDVFKTHFPEWRSYSLQSLTKRLIIFGFDVK